MNDFTKTDLTEIHRCLKYMTKGGTTPYSCHTLALVKKVREMIEGFCDHKFYLQGCGDNAFAQCFKCGEISRVVASE